MRIQHIKKPSKSLYQMNDKYEESQEFQDYDNLKDWPIEPRFLSLREGITDKYGASPNKNGLFYASELRGILADASAVLWEKRVGTNDNDLGEGQIFALFQVVRKLFKPQKANNQNWFVEFEDNDDSITENILKTHKIIRIHPGNLYPNSECCELFRNTCTYESEKNGIKEERQCSYKCFEMDGRIALLYDDKLQKILKTEKCGRKWEVYYNQLDEIIKAFNDEIKLKYEKEGKYKKDVDDIDDYLLKIDTHKHNCKGKNEIRPYVGYRCIYSGLMEYFFPIIHAGKIVAVLMHGQCAPQNLKPEDMFKNYRNNLDSWITEKEKSDYEESKKKEPNEKRMLFHLHSNYDPIKEQLEHISEQIEKLEERIENEVKARSRDYVSKNFLRIERQFRNITTRNTNTDINFSEKLEDLRNEIKNLDEKIKNYERLLNIALRSIIRRFNFNTETEFIRIYAIESPIANQVNPNKNTFHLIGDSKYFNPPDNRKYKKVVFNKINERAKPLNKKELLELRDPEPYFPSRYWSKLDGFDPEKDDIRVEFAISPQVAYFIWERYDNRDENSIPFTEYKDYLNLLNHTLLEPYIILDRMKMEKDLENSMRITSHESSQIIPDVIDTINIKETLEALEEDTYSGPAKITIPAYKTIDTSRRLLLLNNLSRRLSFIFKGKNPKLDKKDFHRIIYAPKSLYQRRARLRNRQQINVLSPKELDFYDLMTNYDILSHILFNLIDNAIKYGLRGSNILIEARQYYSTKKNNLKIIDRVTISIISYGAKIEDIDRENIFELYYRSTQAKGEGMGIGLFLVKKLCNLLGYSIECMPSEHLADYHLPIKYHYYKQKNEKFDAPHLEAVVNKDAFDWTTIDYEMSELLPLPTYKNEFKITIPIIEYETLRKKI